METAGEQNGTKIHGKNAVCSFGVCRAHKHLSIFTFYKRCCILYVDSKNADKIKIKLFYKDIICFVKYDFLIFWILAEFLRPQALLLLEIFKNF